MTLATSQGNQPALATLPAKLAATQPEWEHFLGILQAWQRGLQTVTWQAPTLLNGWVNYGSPYAPAGYYMDARGVVHLRGLVMNGTVGASIFTLPSGYLPAYDEIWAVPSLNAFGQIGVDSISGSVQIWNSTGSSTWVSLSGISFSTAP